MDIQSLKDNLQQHLSNKTGISREQMQAWREAYPYFSLPLIIYTQQHASTDKEAIALSSIYTANIDEWATQLGIKPNYRHIYPDSNSTPQETTNEAIDLFLHTYGKEEQYDTDLSLSSIIDNTSLQNNIEKTEIAENNIPLITIPAYDYMSQLEAMPDVEDATQLQDIDLLDKFINADAAGEQLFSRPEFHPGTDPATNNPEPKEDNDTLFSESLAKIYIQQRRYAKALEIIRKLNLNNPEKNIYFADQIRFLEKLIINVKN
ncbi:MAG: hypothetical protein J6J06_06535 [Bacteroidaceae bacterium]|nr:hypothetical protein [Bacteroidaceae bacterium]